MALFIAQKIIAKRFKYEKIFKFKNLQMYKEEVNMILIAEGKEDLIKE